MYERAVHLTVTGRVQGVGYRAWAERESLALGLDGWVRNRRDGSVEALVAGTAEAVGAFIAAAWDGPPAARVDAVVTQEGAGPPVDPGFRVLPTR